MIADVLNYVKHLNTGQKDNRAQKLYLTRKLKFEDYKNFLQANQLENETNHLEKNKLDADSL